MAKEPLEELYVDNPIDRESVPEEPLSFEFLGYQGEPVPIGTVVSNLFGISIGLALVTFLVWVFLPPANLASGLPWMPLVACAVSLLLAAWTLFRCSTPELTDPLIGLVLGISAFVAAILSGEHPRVSSLVQGALLLYAVGEISSHWSLSRWRRDNPLFADDLNDGGIRHAGSRYQQSLQPVIASGLIVVHVPWLIAPPLLLLAAAIVWAMALHRSMTAPAKAFRNGRSLVEHSFGYPDSNELPPGLFRSPMLAKSLRYIPWILFAVASCLPLLVSLAPMVTANWFDPQIGLAGSMITMVGNVVLMAGLWVLLSEEVFDEA